jgi:hypothetical protein
MKIKFSNIVKSLIILGATILSFESFAQDEGLSSYELQDVNNQELNYNEEDKTLLFEPDAKSSKQTPSESSQTSISTSSKAKTLDSSKQSSGTAASKEGEDALSFNFLYYIIQKYKGSDIVDQ